MSEYIEQRLLVGNCLDTLKRLSDDSIDSIVTDPPYGINFMGKAWDNASIMAKAVNGLDHKKTTKRSASMHAGNYDFSLTGNQAFQEWTLAWAKEVYRVLKPGGHLLCFSGSRTYHRMASGIEDAGFEIRDSIHWTYGSGFPKSLDISKAIDKAAKAERKVVGTNPNVVRASKVEGGSDFGGFTKADATITTPATEAAKQWQGWGTALKPSHEPIVLARKPLIGTVAENVLQYKTGGINIDATRIGTDDTLNGGAYAEQGTERDDGWGMQRGGAGDYKQPTGRFPANTLLTHNHDCQDTCTPNCPVATLNQQSGLVKGGVWNQTQGARPFNNDGKETNYTTSRSDSSIGGAARFFHNSQWTPADDITPFIYQAKAGKKERNAGLDGLSKHNLDIGDERPSGGSWERRTGKKPEPRQNFHPTVKPIELMRYLIKLITPPKGTVLDPFLGSGTTAVAAILDGFEWKGCEMTEDYLPIIKGRVAWAKKEVKEKAKQEQLEL